MRVGRGGGAVWEKKRRGKEKKEGKERGKKEGGDRRRGLETRASTGLLNNGVVKGWEGGWGKGITFSGARARV